MSDNESDNGPEQALPPVVEVDVASLTPLSPQVISKQVRRIQLVIIIPLMNTQTGYD